MTRPVRVRDRGRAGPAPVPRFAPPEHPAPRRGREGLGAQGRETHGEGPVRVHRPRHQRPPGQVHPGQPGRRWGA